LSLFTEITKSVSLHYSKIKY